MPRVTITVPDKVAQPYRFPLDSVVVTLGRGAENDIVIESSSVSVRHAEMRRTQNGYMLVDTGSTNGLKLDDQHHEFIPLQDGSVIQLGDTRFHFTLNAEELSALTSLQANEIQPLATTLVAASDDPRSRMHQRSNISDRKPRHFSFASLLLFAVLTTSAFYVGLAVRHQLATGTSLNEKLQQKFLNSPATIVSPKPESQQPNAR